MTRHAFPALLVFLLGASQGCGDEIDKAKMAMEMAKDMAERAEAAGAAEGGGAAEGKAPQTAEEAIAQMGAAVEGLQEGGQLSGPVVNWRDLAKFAPDQVGAFAAKDDVKGKTTSMGKVEVSEVNRQYADGDRSLRLSVADTVFSPMLRTPFNMVAMVNEDSSEGYKKGKKIGGHTALVEWRESAKRSTATVLVGGRFIVSVTINQAESHDEAEKVAGSLNLDELAKLTGGEE